MLYLITWTNWLYPLTFALLTLRRWWRRLVVKRRPAFIASNERQSDEADLRMGNGLRIFLNSTRLEYPYRPHSTTSAFRLRLRLRILEPLAQSQHSPNALSHLRIHSSFQSAPRCAHACETRTRTRTSTYVFVHVDFSGLAARTPFTHFVQTHFGYAQKKFFCSNWHCTDLW